MNTATPQSLGPARKRAPPWLRFVPFVFVFLAGIVLQRAREPGEPSAPPPAAGSAPPGPDAQAPPATALAQPTAPAPDAREPAPSAHRSARLVNTPIQPIHEVPLDAQKVALGERLFHDEHLSKDGTISCASCHDIAHGGDDGRVVSLGIGGARGSINAPTVLNSAFSFRQFWDGRAKTLEDQIDGPIQHPAEMGMQWPAVLATLAADARYAEQFRALYGGAPTREAVEDAIATFERSLVTPDSPFDRYLEGDESALPAEAREGYELFVSLGCISCHQGVNAGGNMFQPMGKMNDYFAERGAPPQATDLGRFNVTGRDLDRYSFKVPTLRNVELTAPYFHDGSAATLEQAVQVMAYVQLGEELAPGEVARIVAFLRSLTGRLPASDQPR